MKTSEFLRKAKAKIDKPQKWCKEDLTSKNGCRFCAYGATQRIWMETGVDYKTPDRVLRDACREIAGHPFVADFNDTSKHGDVMRLFDRAIELAEQAEA